MMRVDHPLCTENALNFVVDEDIPSRLILFWMKLLFVFVFYFILWFICFCLFLIRFRYSSLLIFCFKLTVSLYIRRDVLFVI